MKHHRILTIILCLVLVIGFSTAALASDPTVTWHRFFMMDTDDYYVYGLGGYKSYFAEAIVVGELTEDSSLLPSQCPAYAQVEGKDSNG